MKITKIETIVINMPMLIEGSVLPQQAGRPRTSMDRLLVAEIAKWAKLVKAAGISSD
jgi:hypothetical protein